MVRHALVVRRAEGPLLPELACHALSDLQLSATEDAAVVRYALRVGRHFAPAALAELDLARHTLSCTLAEQARFALAAKN